MARGCAAHVFVSGTVLRCGGGGGGGGGSSRRRWRRRWWVLDVARLERLLVTTGDCVGGAFALSPDHVTFLIDEGLWV